MATQGAAPPAAPIPAGYVPFTYLQAQSDHLSNERHWPPYQPLSHMSQHEMDLRAAKGAYEHFHVPWNTHNKYLSSVNKADLAACRDIPRRTPPPFDQAGLVPASSIRPSTSDGVLRHEGGQSAYGQQQQQQLRPQSASPTKKQLVRERVKQMEYAEAARRLVVTQTGVPCYTTSALVVADLEHGAPLDGPLPEPEAWRESRVQTYALLPSQSGYAEGGVRPFHQDYRHYKYFGFAGKGGKTSWAYNPKYKYLQTYRSIIRGDADADSPYVLSGHTEPPPLEVTPGGPRRPLTPTEQKLVSAFPEHSYAAESPMSPARPGSAIGPAASPYRQQLRTSTQASPTKAAHHPNQLNSPPSAEIIDPFYEHVDLQDNRPATVDQRGSPARHSPTLAKVATYRQPSPSVLTNTENVSPQFGSQSPFHQRYAHYKQYGFGGRGATSSWARNPKYAYL